MRIILNGCLGRMGKAVSACCKKYNETIIAGIDTACSGETDYPYFSSFEQCPGNADVIVDFSSHSATGQLVQFAYQYRLPLLIATTGHTNSELDLIKDLSLSVPVFMSSNMSLGIAILEKICREVTLLIGKEADIEIIEKHHNQKMDAPSGTAITIASAIRSELDEQADFVYNRTGVRAKRSKNEIGISCIRAGNIIGEHEILFAWGNEILSFKHTALGRDIFAEGALRAAAFVAKKAPGFYTMKDMLTEAVSED